MIKKELFLSILYETNDNIVGYQQGITPVECKLK